MKQIFGGGGPPSSRAGPRDASTPPAPRLDASGSRSDSLVLSWAWPTAPAAQFTLCWREQGSGSAWSRQALGAKASFSGHVVRGLSPNLLQEQGVRNVTSLGGYQLSDQVRRV